MANKANIKERVLNQGQVLNINSQLQVFEDLDSMEEKTDEISVDQMQGTPIRRSSSCSSATDTNSKSKKSPNFESIISKLSETYSSKHLLNKKIKPDLWMPHNEPGYEMLTSEPDEGKVLSTMNEIFCLKENLLFKIQLKTQIYNKNIRVIIILIFFKKKSVF